jgi:hypothetical protein
MLQTATCRGKLRSSKPATRSVGRLQRVADMPDRTMHMLLRFLRQNNGKLPNRAWHGEFATLRPADSR